jgi:hypothetical protein
MFCSQGHNAIAIATAKPAVAPVDGRLVNCDPSTAGSLAEPSSCTALLADVPAVNTAGYKVRAVTNNKVTICYC